MSGDIMWWCIDMHLVTKSLMNISVDGKRSRACSNIILNPGNDRGDGGGVRRIL